MPSNVVQDRKQIGGRWIRWNEERAVDAYARGLWTRETLVDCLRKSSEQEPHRLVLIDGEVRLTCLQLWTQALVLADAMLARAPAGSVVSFLLPNWHEAAVIYMAATLAGMVINPILPSLRDHELLFILNDVGTRIVFVPAVLRGFDYAAMLSRVTQQLPRPPEVVVVRGDGSTHSSYATLMQGSNSARAMPMLEADAVRMILYTSGTTGRPKGVLHSHNSIHALIRQIGENWLVKRGDKFLVPSPIAHIGGSIYAFESPLLLGTTAVLMERWNADEAVKLLDAEACTHMAGATPFLEQILKAAQTAATRVPSLKLFVCGGASVPPALIRRAAAYFEAAVVTRVYGSSEVPVTTIGVTNRADAAHAADTDGQAGFADIKLVGHNSAPSGEGEIHARGPQMLLGYLHVEDELESFDAEGYFRTGDLARWVDDNYLVVTGRAKDIIIRNGENISPKEVEDILIGHPDIAEIAIVGVPDTRTGERAFAVIVAKNAPGPDVASLRVYLDAQGVATFKAPEQVLIWDALPKNDAGKVMKHQIRATIAQKS
jgi:acyl-CoA synthetase (AMP-forming)/AMP-acid ligase II